ncbi:hypothetical protein AUC31_17505 [Planococcus rifietoensis]|uniref:Rho termination factor N-terminal domain-containing protein n=1 Tax=Planococcus rifietoensis TaxID=200991 RepID=A0A0U2N7R2_9BACL|nr:hypothetical protein [Planococcus rifietoensis]ALS76905.1 hypothetical protein AUC31_17505 [Planococcus rifietoensis]
MGATTFQRMRREQAKTKNTEMKDNTQNVEILKGKTRAADIESKEDDDVAKYSKGADRTRTPVEPKVEEAQAEMKETVAAEEAANYSTFTEAELKKVKNDDLKAYLGAKGVEYKSDAVKEDYVKAILGE